MASFSESRVTKVSKEFDDMSTFSRNAKCRGTFLFFGSARAISQAAYDQKMSALEAKATDASLPDKDQLQANIQIATLKAQAWIPAYWDKTRELARLLTVWAKSAEGVHIGRSVKTNFPETDGGNQPLVVCTGGGPGFMEAGNLGAIQADGRSMGIGVVLPFEARLNDYLTPELSVTCDTFFARKYWEVFMAKAMIVCPGGVGTCDEMFEVLTLMQCRKMPKIPVVLLGVEFWTTAVSLRFLADKGMMSHAEIDELCITDSPEEARDFIISFLKAEAEQA